MTSGRGCAEVHSIRKKIVKLDELIRKRVYTLLREKEMGSVGERRKTVKRKFFKRCGKIRWEKKNPGETYLFIYLGWRKGEEELDEN